MAPSSESGGGKSKAAEAHMADDESVWPLHKRLATKFQRTPCLVTSVQSGAWCGLGGWMLAYSFLGRRRTGLPVAAASLLGLFGAWFYCRRDYQDNREEDRIFKEIVRKRQLQAAGMLPPGEIELPPHMRPPQPEPATTPPADDETDT